MIKIETSLPDIEIPLHQEFKNVKAFVTDEKGNMKELDVYYCTDTGNFHFESNNQFFEFQVALNSPSFKPLFS